MFERCLYFNCNALVRQINRIWDEAYAEAGLSAPHAYLLRMVARHQGLTQQKVAEELRLEKSTVTRFVNGLIDKGLLLRKKGEDVRENLLYATSSGARLAVRLDEIGNELYSRMRKELGGKHFDDLVSDMRVTLERIR